jgi:hypothetical protein
MFTDTADTQVEAYLSVHSVVCEGKATHFLVEIEIISNIFLLTSY